MFKKIFALLLVLAIMLSSVSVMCLAADTNTKVDAEEQSLRDVIACMDALESEIKTITIVVIIAFVLLAVSLCWNIILRYKINTMKDSFEAHITKKKKKS